MPNGRVGRTFSLAVDRRGRYGLYENEIELVRSRDLERVREALIGSAGFYFAESSPARTFIHAGVVGWQGHGILLPGRQNSGKTTLTAALVRAGATYLSDEFAPIDDRGRVHPFPRPLSFRRDDGRSVKLRPVETIGGAQGMRSLPVGLVVIAPFSDGRRWRPRRLVPGRGVLEILAYTGSAQTRPRQALDRLARVVARAPVLKGGRGEADETARLILKRLEATISSGSNGAGHASSYNSPKPRQDFAQPQDFGANLRAAHRTTERSIRT